MLEVTHAAEEAPTDVLLGNAVATHRHPLPNAPDGKFRIFKPEVDQMGSISIAVELGQRLHQGPS